MRGLHRWHVLRCILQLVLGLRCGHIPSGQHRQLELRKLRVSKIFCSKCECVLQLRFRDISAECWVDWLLHVQLRHLLIGSFKRLYEL